ncbi:hypothetical protein RRG08_018998 [Elysia crispata]|uniref:Uncharacterized protein n=1 Tax=Elysia crispata TaxID=231223 RepID=A0AAE1A5J4_9GAST|nr:hypothetical protein RRG08_018998 [Elysia crispata]
MQIRGLRKLFYITCNVLLIVKGNRFLSPLETRIDLRATRGQERSRDANDTTQLQEMNPRADTLARYSCVAPPEAAQ